MIDIENEVFSTVATQVRATYPKIYMVGEYVKSPSQFPWEYSFQQIHLLLGDVCDYRFLPLFLSHPDDPSVRDSKGITTI